MDPTAMPPGAPPAPTSGMQAPGADAQQMSAEGEDPQAEQQFETILAGLLEFVFGKGKAGIEKQLKDAKDIAQTIGQITFTLIEEASKQAQQAQQELDMDVLFGVAAELIDSLIRMAQKLGQDIDEESAREEAMMFALQSYLMTAKADPEQQEIAKAMLAEMQAEGATDMAAAELQRMGQRAGVDPFEEQGAPQEPPPGGGRFTLMGG